MLKYWRQFFPLFAFLALAIIQIVVDPGTRHVWEDALLIIPGPEGFFRTRPVVVVISWLACLVAMYVLLISKNKYVQRFSWIWLFITLFINATSNVLTQNAFDVNQYDLVFDEIAHAGGFIKSYQNLILFSCLKVAGLSILLWGFFKLLKPTPPKKIWFLLVLALAGTTANLMRYKGARNAMPSFFSIPGSLIYKHAVKTYYGPRDPVDAKPVTPGMADYVIVIIDESIRYDFLSINNPKWDTTPFLKTLPLINYGEAISAGNSSRHSNLTIRTGLTQNQIPDPKFLSYKKVNLFQYAQAAGFWTVYGNAQRSGPTSFDNFMNKFDLDHINTFENVLGAPPPTKCGDEALVNLIEKEINTHSKAVIYINKIGAHFPYRERYSEKARHFLPDLTPGETQIDQEKTQNSYLNAIRWSVNDFFKELLPRIKNKNYMIVYVSDHGEKIENATRAAGHGTIFNPSRDEVSVPFLVITSNTKLREKLQHFLPFKKNCTTHFDIFPTLLLVLGYDQKWIKEHFGVGLFDTTCQPQRFYSGSIHHTGYWNDFKRI